MSSAISFNLDQSKIWLSGNGLGKIQLFQPCLTLPQMSNLDSSKLKRFAHNKFDCDESGRKVLQMYRIKLGGKENLVVTSNFSFSHNVFKRLVCRPVKTKACFQKC